MSSAENEDPDWDQAPAIIVGRSSSLSFRPSRDRASRTRIFNLRQAEFKGRSDYLFTTRAGLHPAEDEFDEDSFQFSCSINDEVVAACRYSPPLNGTWEASGVSALPAFVRAASTPPLQIGRVVVRSDLRRSLITEVMLCMACRWLMKHTSFTWYFALCLPQLARYYEHFGAQVLAGEDVVLPTRNNKRYQYVHGRLDRSDEAITTYLATDGAGAWSLPVEPHSTPYLSPTTRSGER